MFLNADSAYDYVMLKVKQKFSFLDLKQLTFIKNKLKQRHNINELRTLKADINSLFEKKKNFGPSSMGCSIIFTALFAALATLAVTITTFLTNILIAYAKGEIKEDRLPNDLKNFNGDWTSMMQQIIDSNLGFYLKTLLLISLFIIAYVFLYNWRYQRIAKVNYIIEQALEEKIEETKKNNIKNK